MSWPILVGIALALLLTLPGLLLALWLERRYGRAWRKWLEQHRTKR